MKTRSAHKKEHSLETRKAESERVRSKHPNRIPVIVEKAASCGLPDLECNKFLILDHVPVSHLIMAIRDRIKLTKEKAIFVFVGNEVPMTGSLMSALDKEHRDEDGFLYFTYTGENTFGCH